MRITAGSAKGRKLKAVGEDVRPTASRVREAIFNIIGPSISGATFLDLYAGTGAVGFEALSRGAKSCVFVDINPLRISLIKRLASEYGFKDRVRTYRMKAFSFLKRAASKGESFDYIFIDPPYQSEEIMLVLPVISEHRLIKEDGMVIVEHFSKRRLKENVGSLNLVRQYRYGDTTITTYNYK
ncbi:MAG: 16S rRNA (guanine(966)-N(2))-methyltransferase RsmD [Nitrospirae bacterium]|nr:MAG: 16S rRNA (guanine(966)-N(2))-methyltransferase RsmD [Nitrospirota bacterium]